MQLRQGRLSEVALNCLAEGIEDKRRVLESHLEVLLAHLLKWRYQPERRGRSWWFTIEE